MKLVGVVLVMLLSACKPSNEGRRSSVTANDENRAGQAPAVPATTGSADAKKSNLPVIAETDVDALLAAWLKAQNGGDFESYKALYADGFTGVLRVGAKAKHLDRAGWFESRAKMFKRKMTVAADGITLELSPTRATVTFVQHFELGTFRDVGPKRIVLLPSRAGLRIISEEMLESTVDPVKVAPMRGELDGALADAAASLAMGDPVAGRELALGGGRTAVALFYEERHPPSNEFEREDVWGTFVLAAREGARWKELASARFDGYRGIHLEGVREADIDADGTKDLLVQYRIWEPHASAKGIGVFTTRHPGVYTFDYRSGDGENGWSSEHDTEYACFTTIDGALALVQLLEAEQTKPIDEDLSNLETTITWRARFLVDTGKELEPQTLYGTSLDTAMDVRALVVPWRNASRLSHEAEPTTRDLRLFEVERCLGGDHTAFIVPRSAVAPASAPFHLVAGLTRDRAAAEAAAAKHGGRLVTLTSAK